MQKVDIQIKCADEFEIAGTLYQPANIRGAVMIGPATGIKRRFYNAFATHLAENGYGVISYDNRGIGDSVKGSINKVNASLITWGTLDMTAALEQLKSNFPNQKYHLIRHSAGGQLVGLMNNALDLRSMFNYASSSGSIRNMTYPFKTSAIFFMNYFIPINNLLFGKTNSQWVGMGEPLPKKVAAQWNQWCNGTGYVATDFGKAIQAHLYDDLTLPSLWVHATDDAIANRANVEDMIRVYTKTDAKIIELNPKELGLKEIGHMNFFRSKNKHLWSHALNWLNQH